MKETVFDVTVPDGATMSVAAAICGDSFSKINGKLIKRGLGTLELNARAKVYDGIDPAKADQYDYWINLDALEGTLKLSQTVSHVQAHFGHVYVAENATFIPAYHDTSLKFGCYQTLTGSGTVTTDVTCWVYVVGSCEFAGKLCGPFAMNNKGYFQLTGTESTINSDSWQIWGLYANRPGEFGTLGVTKFGLKGDLTSSVGTVEVFRGRDGNGAVIYLGTGETTDKDFGSHDSQAYRCVLDAGAHGGLIWNGDWVDTTGTFSTSKSYQRGMTITGSNTVACVMNGLIDHRPRGSQSSEWRATVNICKQGTGTWRINRNAGNAGNKVTGKNWGMCGVWEVENGTLQFDTIAPKGIDSALGDSTELFKDSFGITQKVENAVNYAFTLGGGIGKTRGNLEYVGNTNCVSLDRRFSVKGTGAVLNNGTGSLKLADFNVLEGVGDSTLVLGGANTGANSADLIVDGADGKLAVTKEGAGTWRIGPQSTFTGPLTVKGGKLLVGTDPATFQYYRWVIKACFFAYAASYPNSYDRQVGLKAFALFDEDGNDRAYGLSDDNHFFIPASDGNYQSYAYDYTGDVFGSSSVKGPRLAPGEFMVTLVDGAYYRGTITSNTAGETSFGKIFSHPAAGACDAIWNRMQQTPPMWNDGKPNKSWYSIVMRPTAGKPIVAWDFVHGVCNRSQSVISNCTLEASVDGIRWQQLAEVNNDVQPKSGVWQSDGVKYDGTVEGRTGMAIPSRPEGTAPVTLTASVVSVEPGAELAGVDQVTVSKIVLDGATGAGKFTNVSLAEGGVIDILVSGAGKQEIDVDFGGLTLPANFQYTVNGATTVRPITYDAERQKLVVDVVPSVYLFY